MTECEKCGASYSDGFDDVHRCSTPGERARDRQHISGNRQQRLTKDERFQATTHVERLMTAEEIFAAGVRAGHDLAEPPMGPATYARNEDDAWDLFLQSKLR